jgi:hypothetical protein
VWKNGAATDLGPLDGFHIGIATTINMSETIAGFSIFPTVGDASTKRGCLWVGGVTYDLNDLVVGSPIIIEAAQHINDAGSILVRGSGSSCAILHPL